MTEIGRQRAEVRAIDGGREQEIALIPIRIALTKVGGEDAEVAAVDDAVQVSVAEQCVFDFDLAGNQPRDDAVLSIGVSNTIEEAIRG